MTNAADEIPHHTQKSVQEVDEQYGNYVNPEWVKLLNVLGMNEQFERSEGALLHTTSGRTILDFLGGYGVYNVGHNHPHVIESLIDELRACRPSMLQSHVPPLAGELAERLCKKAGGRVSKVYFGSSGSEGVESAMKFARAYTKRDWILFGKGGFHGLTCGALSLMSDRWWCEGFGRMVPETKSIPFNDIESLKEELEREEYACYIVEPIQGESGVQVPSSDYLKEAQALCDKHGTLLVIDEVQTGVHRTGTFLASQQLGVTPDMVIMAKALSGGEIPVGALLMRDDICRSVYTSVDKAFVHASTFGENALAMRAGLATLDICENENLEAETLRKGELLRSKLRSRLEKYEILQEVRGMGLMNAIHFKPPTSLTLKMLFKGFHKVHPGLFGQMIIRTLFREEGILCQMAGSQYMVIKSMPPLVVTDDQIEQYAAGLENVVDMIINDKTRFWKQGLEVGAKAFKSKIR